MRGLIDSAFQKAVSILTTNRAVLDRVAQELLARETLSADQLLAVVAQLAHTGDVATPDKVVGIAAKA